MPKSLKPLFSQSHQFSVGDVVECINTDPWPCDEDGFMPEWLVKGKIYRIVWTGIHPIHGPSVNICADPPEFVYVYAHHADRFRHVRPEQDEILEMIKRTMKEKVS